jgi:hypothetical protein
MIGNAKSQGLTTLVLLIATSISCFACCSWVGNVNTVANPTISRTRTEAIARIREISPLLEGENAFRQRWRVDLDVVRVLSLENGASVREGQKAIILVHSVVMTFGADREDVIGKEFRIVYRDPYQESYSGGIDIFASQ